MQNKILVLGALGNVGTETINHLLRLGFSVRAGDLFPEKIRERFGDAVEAVHFDFSLPESYAPAFNGIRKLFLMRPPQVTDIQRLMVPALEAAKDAGVTHMVFLSLIGIEDNRVVPHYKVEAWLKQSGLAYTFLRCSFFMQNLNSVHRAEIRERDEIYVPVGSACTSFIDVRDIGEVAALALTQPGHENQAYDLTGGEALNYTEVAALFTEVLGRKITYKDPSPLRFFFRQVRDGAKIPFALVTTWLYGNTRKGMADMVTREVERLTGHPPISLRQYIQDYRAVWENP